MSIEVKEAKVLRVSEQGGEKSCMGRELLKFVELPLETPDKESGMPACRETTQGQEGLFVDWKTVSRGHIGLRNK